MPGIYGGDDISAIVVDAGSSSLRAGWAGEDTPRALIPSYYGWMPATEEELQAQFGAREGGEEAVQNGDGNGGGDTDAMEGVETADGGEGEASAVAEGGEKNGEVTAAAATPALAKRAGLSDWEIQKLKAESRKRFVGDSGVNIWRPDMEIGNPFEDGILTSSAALLALSRFALAETMGAETSEHPLLLTEPSWNTREAREELTEMAFEGLNVPAFYLANSTVLSSFSAGKPTALIVDVGASHSSAIPVVDGFVLRKGIQRQAGVGGDAVSRALLYDLKHPPTGSSRVGGPVDIVPQYLVKSKVPVQAGNTAVAKLREDRRANTSESLHKYYETRTLHDAKESLSMVLDLPWDEQQALSRPSRLYEFPNGYNDTFGIERYRASELLFTPQIWSGVEGVLPTAPSAQTFKPISEMIIDAIAATDVDSRATLLQNIVVVGGGASMPRFNDRLSWDLGLRAAGQKIKVHSPGNQVERRFSSWLGGSILASLGTFHQLWISKQEYEEHGSAVVHARCR